MFKEDESVISKADVLGFLKTRITKAIVEDIAIVRAGEYLSDPESVVKRIKDTYQGDGIVVRSSSVKEDSYVTSNAGHFDSVLGVDSGSDESISEAINHVLESYKDTEDLENYPNGEYPGFMDEQVLVQRETKDVVQAGVIFTRDILKNRPYFTVNFSNDGTTDAVTSGRDGRSAHIALDVDETRLQEPLRGLIIAVREILALCSIDNLDIEYGAKNDGTIVIFQCRPLAAVNEKPRLVEDTLVFEEKKRVHSQYGALNHKLSDMAFWNPSEIIGDNPFPLDYSLYREIITAYIWSAGISSMGYHYVNEDLMYKLGNKPYISVDYSFQGLIPEMISPRLQRKLKNYYINRLIDDPSAHDKIEFEIVFSVFDFCTDENMDVLLDYGFTKNEINELRKALFIITELAVLSYSDVYEEDMAALERMRRVRADIRSDRPELEMNPEIIVSYIGQLLYSIKSDGTPQFSRMARLAFIAKSLAKTLVSKGYVSEDEMDLFNRSINTVASDFERDFDALSHGKMNRNLFVEKYGHLRLGTYNIRTDCYSFMYFDVDKSAAPSTHIKERITDASLDKEAVNRALQDYELGFDADVLINYMRRTTENREFFKFEFTKSLSFILNLMIRLGAVLGISREDMSFLEIMDIFETTDVTELKNRIARRKSEHAVNSSLILPEVIFDDKDIDVIFEAEARPNFITTKSVVADTVMLDGENGDIDVEGKIVVITKADPGYDWIFTRGIAGFISKYGGAASHMAIRCAEFDVPAAIGCGDKLYSKVCEMTKVSLDCEKKTVTEG